MRAIVADLLARCRRATPPEIGGVIAGLAAWGYLVWDSALWDARLQLVLHLGAIAAALGLLALVGRRAPLPRTPLDGPILALLAAFALATLLALNLGMSLRAMASIAAFASMLPVALLVLRRHASLVALVVALPVVGLAAGALGTLLGRRVEWVLAGAPGIPPLRVAGEGTPFGSVAVPPFVLAATWALAGHLDPRWRRPLRGALVGVGIPLAMLSGSRSAWLALAVTVTVLAAPTLWRRRRLPWAGSPGGLVTVAAGGLAAAALFALVVVPRLTAVTSLLYRGDLWGDTLRAWAVSPWTGIGPGFMPFARHAAAAPGTFPVSQPHSHNLAIGILGDAGIVGVAAAIAVVVAFLRAAGPWRSRTAVGREAGAVLLGFLAAGMFEDLTFLPGFVLLVLLLAATALEAAGAVRWAPIRRRALVATGAVPAGVALVVAAVVADAGAVAYRMGVDATVDGAWTRAADAFGRASTLDRWHPTNPDAHAVALVTVGDLEAARAALDDALLLDPGNGRAWTNRALVCEELGDRSCAVESARRAVETASRQNATLINAALVLDAFGLQDEADAAYRQSLLTHPLTSLAVSWPRSVSVRTTGVGAEPDGDPPPELNLLLAELAVGGRPDPAAFTTASVRALAAAAIGNETASADARAEARTNEGASLLTWDVELALGRAAAEDVSRARRIHDAIAGRPAPAPDGSDPRAPVTFDIGAFRAIPATGFVALANDLRTVPPYPWILAAVVGSATAGR